MGRASNFPPRDLGSNRVATCRVEPWSSSSELVNEYLALACGGYFCKNSLRTLITTWLETCQRR